MRAQKLPYIAGMKMFFSVFFGVFCAIIAAAAVLYFIKEYQDAEGARQLLQETRSASDRMTTYAGVPSPAPHDTTLNGGSVETKSEAMLVQPVTIKTADGELTIPAGKTVHPLNEKSAAGTVVVKYEGYAFVIPLAAIGAVSR